MNIRLYRYIAIGLITSAYLNTQAVAAPRISIIKSTDLTQFQTVAGNIQSHLPEFQISTFTFKKSLSKEQIDNFMNKNKPALLITLGVTTATSFASHINNIPIIFSMILNYKRHNVLNKKNVAGVAAQVPSQSLFTQFKLLCSRSNVLAVPYHPTASQEVVRGARDPATLLGVKLLPLSIENPSKLNSYIKTRVKSFDALWMLPDFKLYNKRNIKNVVSFLRLANENNKPVMVSSEAFVKAGGLLSVSIDYASLGSQIAILANRVLIDKQPISEIGVTPPIGTKIILNMKIAQQLAQDQILDRDTILDYQADVIITH